MALASAIRVRRPSSLSWLPWSLSRADRMFLTVLIWRSQTPPMWLAWGGLKTNSHPFLTRYSRTLSQSISFRASDSSRIAPTKLVPMSERSCDTVPLKLMKRRMAFMKLSVDMALAISRWIPWLAGQVNSTPHRLSSFRPSLMRKGPKQSTPLWEKGGAGRVLSAGRSAIFCSHNLPLSLRHVTHWEHQWEGSKAASLVCVGLLCLASFGTVLPPRIPQKLLWAIALWSGLPQTNI